MTRVVLGLALAAVALPVAAQPLGTAFTYQGRLVENGTPATGPYDFELKLFDAPAGGAQVGTTLLRGDVPVADGLFTVGLDFGGAAFAGSARWLEIGVRPGADTGAYTTLPGRQELTPAPNALFGATAPWSGVIGKPAGFADDVDNDSGGDITAVATGAASGLTGGATAGAANLAVSFAGSGTASSVSRSDHNHGGQTWNAGLTLTSPSGSGTILNAAATNLSGLTYGVRGSSTSSNGVGVFGEVTATSGPTYAVLGHTHSTAGSAVFGFAIGTTGTTSGVQGISDSTSGRGVYGHALANAGGTHGVLGETESAGNFFVTSGVTGQALSTTGVNFGVRGVAASSAGIGVLGSTTATSGPAIGVWGKTSAIGGVGVLAEGQGANNAATALEIKNGRIKVTGAGEGTPTAAFRIPFDAERCGADDAFTIIDHPHANFNADAILTVTPVLQPHTFAILYWTGGGVCPNNRWLIWHNGGVQSAYNVLVIVP